MPNSLYANTDSHLVSTGGGQFGKIIGAGVGVQAVVSTIPCKAVYISGTNASDIHVGLSSSVNVSVGVQPPVEMIIDDVNKVWLFADAAASVHLTYRQ
jgi:hypothetical protein